MLKGLLRRGALGVLLAYLLFGLLSFSVQERSAERLPMTSWSLSEIERRNQEGLRHVASTLVAGTPATGTSTSGRAAGPAEIPERLLPDLVPLEPSDLSTVGSRAEGSLRLKFTTLIWNAGLGPLETRGARNPDSGELEVYQYVYRQPGAAGLQPGEAQTGGAQTGGAQTGGAQPGGAQTGGALPELRAEQGQWVGTFNYDHRHGHLHFDDFAHYELWRVGEAGELLEVVAENAKVGFCLMDIKHMASDLTHLESGLIEAPGGPVYAGCREDVQGISVGWGDEYLSLLFEQDLDLTDVPNGSYAVVVTTNPDRTIEELDYQNNAAVTYLTLEDERVAWSSEGGADGS